MKYWKAILTASILTLSASINAAIVDNGTYTTDTSTGLDWLDLTETSSMSFTDVTAQLGPGGALDGWRYATETEIIGFFDAFGGNNNFYNTASVENNGLVGSILPLWGDLIAAIYNTPGLQGSNFFWDNPNDAPGFKTAGSLLDPYYEPSSLTYDFIDLTYFTVSENFLGSGSDTGSALVRNTSVVPVPAAAWLFGSGLLGLIGLARRKT